MWREGVGAEQLRERLASRRAPAALADAEPEVDADLLLLLAHVEAMAHEQEL